MGWLQECAGAYKNLTDFRYNLVIGRKGKTEFLRVEFRKVDFHHLAGLHKLADLNHIRSMNRENCFDDILSGKISDVEIKSSNFFQEIEKRIELCAHIEECFDDNELVFKFNKNQSWTQIQAKYLLVTLIENKEKYIFLDNVKDEIYYCRSLFPKTTVDYTKGQPKYTLLYKEKENKSTGEKILQLNRLK